MSPATPPDLLVPTGGSRPPVHRTLLRAVELAMAALFLYLGTTKLMGTTESVRLFDVVGIGSWLRYATGTLELIGAALLFSPTLSRAASFPRAVIMAVVAIIEIFILKRPPAAAAVCVTAHGFITWGRRQNARRILADAAQGLGEALPTVERSR
jgi:putative oxidoreductase